MKKLLVLLLGLASYSAYGQYTTVVEPIKASSFVSAGATGCDMLLAATTASALNGLSQSVDADLSGPQRCELNPIATGFTGKIFSNVSATYYIDNNGTTSLLNSPELI